MGGGAADAANNVMRYTPVRLLLLVTASRYDPGPYECHRGRHASRAEVGAGDGYPIGGVVYRGARNGGRVVCPGIQRRKRQECQARDQCSKGSSGHEWTGRLSGIAIQRGGCNGTSIIPAFGKFL